MEVRHGSLILTTSTLEDAMQLGREMREADAVECMLLSDTPPMAAAIQALEVSEHSVTARDLEGRLVGMYGFMPYATLGQAASPWLLGTDLLWGHKKVLVQTSRHVVKSLLKGHYRFLSNVVWDKNRRSIRYLKAVGFEFGPLLRTRNGTGMYQFYMHAEEAKDV